MNKDKSKKANTKVAIALGSRGKVITLDEKEVNRIVKFMVASTKYTPEKVIASAKWQKQTTLISQSLGID